MVCQPDGPFHLVTFYQQLVLRKPLNHQLLEILGRKYLASLDIQYGSRYSVLTNVEPRLNHFHFHTP
jgi:hypothetical protein